MITYGTNEPSFGPEGELPENVANGHIHIVMTNPPKVLIYDEENDTWYPEGGA